MKPVCVSLCVIYIININVYKKLLEERVGALKEIIIAMGKSC